MRNWIQRAGGTSALRRAIRRWISAAHCDRVGDALELHQHAVAGGLDDAALALGDRGVDQLEPVGLEPRERARLVGLHEPAVADHVGRENRRQPPCVAVGFHRACLAHRGFQFSKKGPAGMRSDAESAEGVFFDSVASRSRRRGIAMKTEELRALQAPVKERYKADPDAALVTLRAEGRLGEDVTCKVDTGRALVAAGLHPASGGDGLSACSGDMLLEALVACAGVTLAAVATATGIVVRSGTVHAEGDLDFRGTLGVDKSVPVGFQRIRLHFDLDTDASEEQMSTLMRLTERYCVVYQTLCRSPEVAVSHRVHAA